MFRIGVHRRLSFILHSYLSMFVTLTSAWAPGPSPLQYGNALKAACYSMQDHGGLQMRADAWQSPYVATPMRRAMQMHPASHSMLNGSGITLTTIGALVAAPALLLTVSTYTPASPVCVVVNASAVLVLA